MSMKMTVSWIAALSLAVGQPFSLCAGEESWQSDFKRPSSGFVPLDVVAPQAPQAPQAQDPSSRPPEDSLRAGPSPSPRRPASTGVVDAEPSRPAERPTAGAYINGGVLWNPLPSTPVLIGGTMSTGPDGSSILEQNYSNGDVQHSQTWQLEDGTKLTQFERFNADGQLIQSGWNSHGPSEMQGYTNVFDESGNPSGSSYYSGEIEEDGSYQVTSMSHDAQGALISSSTLSVNEATGQKVWEFFDLHGHLTSRTTQDAVTPGLHSMVTEFFNTEGQLTGSLERSRLDDGETLVERDAQGNEIQRQDRQWGTSETGDKTLTITTSKAGSQSVLTVTGSAELPISAVLNTTVSAQDGSTTSSQQQFAYQNGAWQAVDASGNVQAGVPIPEILNALASNLVP